MTLNIGPCWANLPEELKNTSQWCIAAPDKSPYIQTANGLQRASVHEVNLHTFGKVCEIAAQYEGAGIGFILKSTDPFTCIDIDILKNENATTEELERCQKIIEAFDSYTEKSVSGKGLHIWVAGKIGAGCRRDGIEVYSQERFIVCTGDIVIDKPIQNKKELLDILVDEIRGDTPETIELVEEEEEFSDSEIFEKCMAASNADKFSVLCEGHWQHLQYPSQSEADLALMSIFAFYSKSNEQCRRLFRMTALGKRAKATKNDRYLNYALTLIRSRQAAQTEIDKMASQQGEQLAAQLMANLPPPVQTPVQEISVPAQPVELPPTSKASLDYPPGLVGEIAKFIYASSPRPVKEVSIVAALGLMAGICGKAYHLPQSGLNVYLILVARSAIGKEAMHSGLSHILARLRESIPSANNFVDFSDFASGPALVKACATNPCFVNVAGEWGKKLARLAKEDGRDGPMQGLRTVMTNLYQKSGPAAIVGGITYSNKESNVSSINGVAYSMIGETTPGVFYDSLTEGMMEDGFLSRFTIVEHVGDRPPANKNPVTTLPNYLTEAISAIVVQALTLLSRYHHCPVQFSPEAQAMLDAFDRECDRQINSTMDEGWRQMWNRAHLKTCRIAALLAVGDNYLTPVIHLNHVQWALDLVRKDIALMARRIDSGDVGQGDSSREKKVLTVIEDYLKVDQAASYKVDETMRKKGIIPRRYIQLRLQRLPLFAGHKAGATRALDDTLRSLMDSGYLVEVARDSMAKEFAFSGRCFRVVYLNS